MNCRSWIAVQSLSFFFFFSQTQKESADSDPQTPIFLHLSIVLVRCTVAVCVRVAARARQRSFLTPSQRCALSLSQSHQPPTHRLAISPSHHLTISSSHQPHQPLLLYRIASLVASLLSSLSAYFDRPLGPVCASRQSASSDCCYRLQRQHLHLCSLAVSSSSLDLVDTSLSLTSSRSSCNTFILNHFQSAFLQLLGLYFRSHTSYTHTASCLNFVESLSSSVTVPVVRPVFLSSSQK